MAKKVHNESTNERGEDRGESSKRLIRTRKPIWSRGETGKTNSSQMTLERRSTRPRSDGLSRDIQNKQAKIIQYKKPTEIIALLEQTRLKRVN